MSLSKFFQVNPEKLQNVQQKLEAFLAQEKEQKERAQRCFVSYLRSIYLMKNKEVFDVFKLQTHEYALSLGLAVAPRVRFLSKAQAQRDQNERQRVKEQSEEEEEEELSSLKDQLKGADPQDENQSSESEDSDRYEESGNEKQVDRPQDINEKNESDNDLRDLDLLIVKRKDVFNLAEYHGSLEEPTEGSKKKMGKETKFKEAKKVLKRNFQVNSKVAFNEEGEAIQLWPPVQQVVTGEEEEEEDEEVSGINLEKAKERLKREDQVFDKEEYRRKVKVKHTEKRLKAKAARREASKKHGQKSDEEEEDEVMAYLANHSDEEFDPSTLPDPDKLCSDEEEEELEEEMRSAKRQHSESSDEEELTSAKKKKKVRQQSEEHRVLDTGLSLAEDEELVLHLLGGQM